MTDLPLPAWLRTHAQPLLALVALALAANLPALSGLFNTSPALAMSGLGVGLRAGWLHEPMGWMDPSVGFLSQPLGQLAMRDWLHGIVPWWNPYSGLGMPLAAELEAPSFFFPFNIVMRLDNGWIWMRVLLQALAGIFTYALLVELGLARLASLLGGGLFALSPEFLVSPHASIAPLPFLPLLLLGVEHAARGKRSFGLIGAGLAWSITGAFPEVALFDGLLVAVWSLFRLAPLRGKALVFCAWQLALGVGLGVGVTAPLLLPFLEFVQRAYLGPHASPYFLHAVMPVGQRALQVLPWAFGEFAEMEPSAVIPYFTSGWVRLPGWIDLQVLIVALAALWRGRQNLGLRWVLAGWVIFWELRYAGFPPAMALIDALPGLGTTDCMRFSGPSVNFALYVLAALGFNDYLSATAFPRRRFAGLVLSLVAVLAVLILPAWDFFRLWYAAKPLAVPFGAICIGFGVAMLGFAGAELYQRRFPRVLAAVLVGGLFCELAGAELSGARGGHLDLAPVRYLQAHAGVSRIVSLGPLGENFNVPYNIGAITYAAMPSPQLMADEISHHLAPADLAIYSLYDPANFSNVVNALPRYAADGVGYVVTASGVDWQSVGNFAVLPPGTPQTPQALPLGGEGLVYLLVLPPDAPRVISGISVRIATYAGRAHGMMMGYICTTGHCSGAPANFTGELDNHALTFQFPQPFTVATGFQPLAFRFTQYGGVPAALWVGAGAQGQIADIQLLPVEQASHLAPVFDDGTVAIYHLPNAAPYASAPGCTVTVLDRTHFHATCPTPARLTRLEMTYPGWQAQVNGVATPVSSDDGLFQSIAVPAGSADITFTYTPTHIRLAELAALLCALLWLGLTRTFKNGH